MKAFTFLLALLVTGVAGEQPQNPVHWTFSAKRLTSTIYEIHLTATIGEHWHIYSQSTPEGGPVVTKITFDPNPQMQLSGIPVEVGKPEEHFEKLFGVDVKQYSSKIDFVQKVTLKKPVKINVSGSIHYMVSNDQTSLPPSNQSFSVSLP